MTTPLESKGLRLFRERVERILPEEVRGQTWHAKSGWLRNCASQGPIRDIFVQLMKDLGPISQAKDETPEGRLGDEIRDVADILWYAMEEKTRERAEALVVAMTAAVKPLDLARWRPCSPLWWYGWASGRCRRHHYHDHGCALGVCRPGRARADCTRNCLTSHGVVRGWKYRNYQGSNLCSTQPAGATEMSTR